MVDPRSQWDRTRNNLLENIPQETLDQIENANQEALKKEEENTSLYGLFGFPKTVPMIQDGKVFSIPKIPFRNHKKLLDLGKKLLHDSKATWESLLWDVLGMEDSESRIAEIFALLFQVEPDFVMDNFDMEDLMEVIRNFLSVILMNTSPEIKKVTKERAMTRLSNLSTI